MQKPGESTGKRKANFERPKIIITTLLYVYRKLIGIFVILHCLFHRFVTKQMLVSCYVFSHAYGRMLFCFPRSADIF